MKIEATSLSSCLSCVVVFSSLQQSSCPYVTHPELIVCLRLLNPASSAKIPRIYGGPIFCFSPTPSRQSCLAHHSRSLLFLSLTLYAARGVKMTDTTPSSSVTITNGPATHKDPSLPGPSTQSSSSSSFSGRIRERLKAEVDTKEVNSASVFACFLTGFTSANSFSVSFDDPHSLPKIETHLL